MELVFYFIFVAAAISGIFYLLKIWGRAADAEVTEDIALELLSQTEPEASIDRLKRFGPTIWMVLTDHRVAIARAIGCHPTLHVYPRQALIGFSRVKDGALVRFKDYAMPQLHVPAARPEAIRAFLSEAVLDRSE